MSDDLTSEEKGCGIIIITTISTMMFGLFGLGVGFLTLNFLQAIGLALISAFVGCAITSLVFLKYAKSK